jgi:hypothetical protein
MEPADCRRSGWNYLDLPDSFAAVDVIFVEPCFPANQREFVRALHAVGARVIGIGERPKSSLNDDLRHQLTHYEQIGNVTDAGALEHVVRKLQSHPGTNIQRLEASVEAHVMAAAKVREACGIPGISVETTFLCRDKPAMKEARPTRRKSRISASAWAGRSS